MKWRKLMIKRRLSPIKSNEKSFAERNCLFPFINCNLCKEVLGIVKQGENNTGFLLRVPPIHNYTTSIPWLSTTTTMFEGKSKSRLLRAQYGSICCE